MFERFTRRAREAVATGAELARDGGAEQVAPVHLLAAIVLDRRTLAVTVLEGYDVDRAALEADLVRRGQAPAGLDDDDAEALASIGIDLEEVLRHVTPGTPQRRLPRFSRASKKCLELALREAIALKHNYIGTEHLLLGIVRAQDPASTAALTAQGVDLTTLRAAVRDAVRRAG